jgi:hypothetical protein
MLMKMNDLILIRTFSIFSWLEKNSRDYHPMFIASFTKFQLILKKYVLGINASFIIVVCERQGKYLWQNIFNFFLKL